MEDCREATVGEGGGALPREPGLCSARKCPHALHKECPSCRTVRAGRAREQWPSASRAGAHLLYVKQHDSCAKPSSPAMTFCSRDSMSQAVLPKSPTRTSPLSHARASQPRRPSPSPVCQEGLRVGAVGRRPEGARMGGGNASVAQVSRPPRHTGHAVKASWTST